MSGDDVNKDAQQAEKRVRADNSGADDAEQPPSKVSKVEESNSSKLDIAATAEVTPTETADASDAPAAQVNDDSKNGSPKVTDPLTEDGTTVPIIASNVTTTLSNGLPHGLPPSEAKLESVMEEKDEISAAYVGRVIGKGGEMIRDLQARSACRIDVDQNVPPGQPRWITYRGSRKTVDFAKQLVHMLCQGNLNEADLPLGEAKREFLVVPASSVGKIIGRGGEMIRELQSRSQAKIQVDHRGQSGLDVSQKQVTMTGTEQSVDKAKEMVLFLVANPMMDAMQSINMLIDDKIQRGGVWGSGPPYPNLPQNGQNMQPSGGGGNGYGQSYGGGGNQGSYGGAPYGGAPQFYQQQQQQQQQPPVTSFGGGVESEVFYAAKHHMGRVIGSKGVTINDLQRKSGCDIQVNQDVPPSKDCEITLRGTRQGIEMAKSMLREVIESGPNHPYQGGTGSGGQSFGGHQQGGYGQQQQQQQPYGYQAQGGYQPQQQYGQGSYGQNPGYAGTAQAQQYPQAQLQGPPQAYGAPPGVPPVSEWKAATAPDGQQYYYNERSGETTWQKPPGMP
mmetsp:Transcript_33936/g.37905  ORF Transcript_33936/g.37905 Transcript_33936/m.37905 type:complete len:561 (-) Transcript_33936:562-2244(-)